MNAWYHRACSRGPGLLRYLVHSYILQVGARDAVHHLVVIVTFLSIKSQFVTFEDHEMLLEGLSLCFKVALAGVIDDVLIRILILKASKALQDHLWCP